MRLNQPLRIVRVLAVLTAMAMAFSTDASAAKERVIHNFQGRDGAIPNDGLVLDSGGNLFGTTQLGGTANPSLCPQGCGVVFELTPTLGGVSEKVLYKFCSSANCADGAQPLAGVVLDSAGDLYGTAYSGGDETCACGVIFELAPNRDGTWTETVLHNFTGGGDGAFPYAGLIFDSDGDLYGTTANGGDRACTSGCGVVFNCSRRWQGAGSTPFYTASWADTTVNGHCGQN